MKAAILTLIVTLGYAQQPVPCDVPKQWEARFYRTDYSQNYTEYARMSYDAVNKRVRETQEYIIPGERDFYDVVYLFTENKEYRLNLRTHKCNVTAPTRQWHPFGIPETARYDGEGSLGPVNIPREHVTIFRFSGKTDNFTFYGMHTFPDCAPVTFGLSDKQDGYVHTTFYDLTLGISNPSVFTPPSECQG